MRRFALIGATGRVGKLVTRVWRTSSERWSEIPIQTRNLTNPASALHIPWDVRHGAEPLRRWMQAYGKLDCLIILAGTTPSTGENMSENLLVAQQYMDAAIELGIERVLIASSSAVYGVGSALSEESKCNPSNFYGISKLKMEHYLETLSPLVSDVCCMRIGNVVGADALLWQVVLGKPIILDVFRNGHGPLRSYIGPTDLAHVFVHLATTEKKLPFKLNIAAPSPVYMDDLARAADLDWVARSAPDVAVQNLTLNCTKLAKFVKLPINASDPELMVKDWKRTFIT